MDQDFSTFPAEDLDEVARLTVLIAKRLARRRRAAAGGPPGAAGSSTSAGACGPT